MKSLILIFLCFTPILLFAQQLNSSQAGNKGSAVGNVKDSSGNYELTAVTVTVLRKSDSTLMDYQLTNEQGEFNFQNLPLATAMIFNFSFSGYKSFSKIITIDSAVRHFNFKTVYLSRRYGTLDEVVVEVPVPIRMNEDTLEINPAAFKLDSNAVVEDMLRRVPGMTIWGDGNITVNKKTINKVYVDGKPFFGGDPSIATQNLPKTAIDKIQVYQETDYTTDDVDKDPEDSVFTMDIKLKDNKKNGFFGKTGAGIGTDGRYEADMTLQAFNKRSRLGLLGVTNNINKSGDMQSIVRQSTFRNFNPGNSYVANFGGSGINKIIMGGLNYQHDFSDLNNRRLNNQLRGSYNFRQNIHDVESGSNSQQSASGKAFINVSENTSTDQSQNHVLNTGYNKRDRNRDFTANATFNTGITDAISSAKQSSSDGNGDPVSTNENSTTSHNTNKNLSFSTSYRNKDDDYRNLKSFNISYDLNYGQNTSNRRTVTNFVSIADPSKSSSFDRLFNNNSSDFNSSLKFGYNTLKRLLFGDFNLWDINISLSNNLSLKKSSLKNQATDFDTLTNHYSQNGYLTYFNHATQITESPTIRFSRSFTRRLTDRFSRYLNISINLSGKILTDQNSSDISYRNLNRNFGFILPGMRIKYNYKKTGRYEITINLSQNNSAGIPGIDQLYPIIDSTNQYTLTLGNPGLKPYHNNNIDFSLNYTRQNNRDKNEFNFNLFFKAGQTKNGINDSSFFNSDGSRVVYLVNIGQGKRNLNTGFSVNTSFRMKNYDILQLSYSTSFSNNISPNYIDGIYSLSKNETFTHNLHVFLSIGDLATFNISQGINYNNSLQTGKNLRSFSNTTFNTNAGININYPQNFSLGNTFSYVESKNTVQSAALWNAFISYRFLKNKSAEIKFSAMDILRQNHNISINASANNLTTTVTNGLQQFYMVTFSYYPRRFGQKARRTNRTGRIPGGSRKALNSH